MRVRLIGTAMALAASAAPAGAAPRGSLTVDARPGASGDGVQVAANRAGFAVAAWRSPPGPRGTATLRTSTRRRGQAWSRPVDAVRFRAKPAFHLIRLVVDDAGTSHLLWSTSATSAKRSGHLFTATRKVTGAWSPSSEVGPAVFGRSLDVVTKADLAVAADGTATVIWVAGGNDENVLDMRTPATLATQTQAPGGTWGKPDVLFTGQNAADVRVQVDAAGNALATWLTQPPELADAPAMSAYRPAGGAWSPSGRPLPDLAGNGITGGDRPTLVDGVTHLLAQSYGDDDSVSGLYAQLRPDGTADRPAEPVGLPGPADTLGGWVGAGEPQGSVAIVGGDGRPVYVYPATGDTLPTGGGLGTSALWSSTRTAAGGWTVEPVDDLAQASVPYDDGGNWPSPAVSLDRAGRVVATWNTVGPTSRPCTVETFQSTHTASGWTRRTLVAEIAGRSCDGSSHPVGTLASASLVWATTNRTLQIRAVATHAPRATVKPRVRLVTTTWKAIRKAGAIEFSCRAAVGAICHVSLVPAERDVDRLDALEGFCRPTLGSVAVRGASRRGVVRFPLADGCYAGGPVPRAPTSSLRFPILAVADTVGRRSSARRVTLQIRRK